METLNIRIDDIAVNCMSDTQKIMMGFYGLLSDQYNYLWFQWRGQDDNILEEVLETHLS